MFYCKCKIFILGVCQLHLLYHVLFEKRHYYFVGVRRTRAAKDICRVPKCKGIEIFHSLHNKPTVSVHTQNELNMRYEQLKISAQAKRTK